MPALRAPVHYNAEGTLMVIKPLLEQQFGIAKRGNVGTCMLAQIAFTISAVTGIKSSHIARHITKNVKTRGTINGFTLEEILSTFDKPVLTRSGYKKITAGPIIFQTFNDVLDAVLIGWPVILIIDRLVCSVLENEAYAYKDGCVQATAIRKGDTQSWHTLLAMGVDVDGFVVVRDTRHTYCYRGYLKIAQNILRDNFSNYKALGIAVTKVETVN